MTDVSSLITRLAAFPEALRATCAIMSDEDARWNPPDSPPTAHGPAWSVAQIALHMLLEEQQDFRPRVLSTLRDPDALWPPIDPEGAVAEAWGSAGRSLASILDEFAHERAASVGQLRALATAADWSRTHTPRRPPPLRAGQLLACWAAHDALHLRQIAKRLHQLAARDAGAPGDPADANLLGYAGDL